jgi:chorismate mutase
MADLAELRVEIDAIDRNIVNLLAARIDVCRKVAVYKMPRGIPVRIQARIDAVREGRAQWAAAMGLDAEYVRRVYALIIEETCRTEEREMAAHGVAPAAERVSPGLPQPARVE